MGTLSGWLIHLIRGGLPAGGAKLASVDPVCGMRVEAGKAQSYMFEGRTHYFCSRHCLAAFRTDPHKYVVKPP